MKRSIQFLSSALLTLCLVFSAAGQSTKGTLAGRVLDSSGSVLQGAQVQLTPKGLTLASDAQGDFAVTDLSPGNYKVQVSYIGFVQFETDVTITAGEITRLEARMQVKSQSELVIVTAERPRAEAESINRDAERRQYRAGPAGRSDHVAA